MTYTRSAPFVTAFFVVLGGCGGAADESAPDRSSPGETVAGEAGDGGASNAAPGRAATGTVSLEDGTSYTFDMTTCKTSGTDPETFLVDPGYDLFGTSAGGFRLSLNRSGLSEEKAIAVGDLEGEFDANGVNPAVSYTAVGDDLSLSVAGRSVTGNATMNHDGTEVEATIDITC
jgi:hypothetical protein